MAEVIITPADMPVGDSRIHNAWMWMRELMRKAAKGFAQGATKVRVTIAHYAASTAAGVIAAGTQIGLATRAGWNGASAVATKGLGLVAKGALRIAHGASWVIDKIGRGFGWLVGLFNRKAGAAISNGNARFFQWRSQRLGAAYNKVDGVAFFARAAVTSKNASAIGRTTAGVIGLAGIANIATHGAVAAKAVSMIGPKAALLFGPVGLLATAAVGAIAGLFSWMFRRDEVMENAYDMLTIPQEAMPTAQSVPVPTEATKDITIDFTDDGGVIIKGESTHLAASTETAEALAKTIDNGKASQLMGMGMLPVTNDMVEASLRQSGAAPMANGQYSKKAMETRRRALREGHIPLPVMPEAAVPIPA